MHPLVADELTIGPVDESPRGRVDQLREALSRSWR